MASPGREAIQNPQLGPARRAKTENLRTEYHRNVRRLEEQVLQLDGEVQNLRNEAEVLRRMIPTMEDFNQKGIELKEQLEDSRSRLERLCEELTTSGKKQGKTQRDHDEDERSRKTDEEIQKLLVRYRQQFHESRED